MPPLQTSVPFKELTGGYSRDGEQFKTNTVTRRYQVAWEHRQQFINDIMGQMLNINGTPVFRPPASDPEHPWLYAKTYREFGVGKSTCSPDKVNVFTYANIEVTFQPLDGTGRDTQQGGQTYMEVSASIDADFITFDDKFYWQNGPLAMLPIEQTHAGTLSPSLNLTLSVRNWFGAPIGTGVFESKAGHVNSIPIRILWYYFAAETLMFMGATIRRTIDNTNLTGYDIGLTFKHRPNGWNKKLHRDGNWYRIRVGSGGPPPNQESDLNLLLP
jgi:hypothetical protein